MAVSAQRVAVTSTPAAVNTASTGGLVLLVKNLGAEAADLGGSAVASGAGFELAAGATVEVNLDPGDVVYAVAATGTDLAVLAS